jgi:hypothetical protein
MQKLNNIHVIKEFGVNYAVQFTVNEVPVVIGYSPQDGRLLWKVEGRGIRQTTVEEINKWLVRFKEDRGYRALINALSKVRPVVYGKVVSCCHRCDRPVDRRVADYCARHGMQITCYACQKGFTTKRVSKKPIVVAEVEAEVSVSGEVAITEVDIVETSVENGAAGQKAGNEPETKEPRHKRAVYRCSTCNKVTAKKTLDRNGGECDSCAAPF